MKFLVFAYTRMNLGDDLFVDILAKRYPNIEFHLQCPKDFSKALNKNKNLYLYEIPVLEYVANHDFDGVVFIAGSIFMEPKNYDGNNANFKVQREVAKEYKNKNKPFFYISCNFGPYKQEIYYKHVKEYLKLCSDVCFRDKYSCEKFKDLKNIRYAPDAVLSWKYSKTRKIKDSVGITLIEPSIRWYITQDKKEDYYNFLKNNIMYLIDEGKKIYLFSYCDFEGDVIAQKEVLKIIPNSYHKKIKLLNYNGNIKSYLKKYNKMEYTLCGRFHAMILSVIFGHKFFVSSYSDKTADVMNDFKIKNQLTKYEEINPKDIISLDRFKKVNKIKRIILKYHSKKQFKAFDKWLLKK